MANGPPLWVKVAAIALGRERPFASSNEGRARCAAWFATAPAILAAVPKDYTPGWHDDAARLLIDRGAAGTLDEGDKLVSAVIDLAKALDRAATKAGVQDPEERERYKKALWFCLSRAVARGKPKRLKSPPVLDRLMKARAAIEAAREALHSLEYPELVPEAIKAAECFMHARGRQVRDGLGDPTDTDEVSRQLHEIEEEIARASDIARGTLKPKGTTEVAWHQEFFADLIEITPALRDQSTSAAANVKGLALAKLFAAYLPPIPNSPANFGFARTAWRERRGE